MKWFMPIAFIAIAIFGIIKINPLPPYKDTVDLIGRLGGSVIWGIIFIGATISSFNKPS